MEKVKAIVLRAAGINCDVETEYALESAGAQAQRIHVNRIIEDPGCLGEYQILVLPGGFSYGDDVAAGKILANQIFHHLSDVIKQFIEDGKLVLGICNGFQVLVKAGILPGFLMAFFYGAYVVIRCWLQPGLAPPYEVEYVSLKKKIKGTITHVLPLGLIIFLVIGLIFLGVATPSEAAALGALGTILLAAAYRKMNLAILKLSIIGTIRIASMMFVIIVGSMTFSQIMAFSGASEGLIRIVTGLEIPPMMVLISMQVLLLFLGCFMDNLSMVMVAIPIFLPIIHALHFNPLWFSLIMLLNMEMANTTPPFGLLLFVMKGVAPPNTTMGEIYKAGIPFLMCDALVMGLVMIFPQIALYLPGVMK